MAITFKCPACGAPLDYSGDAATGGATTVRCPYCNNTVGVPAELRTAPAPATPAAPAATSAPPVSPADPAAPAPASTPDAIRAQIREMRRASRLQRRALRQEARDLRHR